MSKEQNGVSRRKFAGLAGLASAGAFGAALTPWAAREMDVRAMGMGLTNQALSAEEMDAYHEAGVSAFPAETRGKGNQPLEYEMDGDVKVFRLTCDIVSDWEFDVGKTVKAWTYNGVVPGPEIRVTEGDRVRVH